MVFGNNRKLEEFEEAALPHLNDLYRTAVRVVRDRVEADDVLQETYFQAWKSWHRFQVGTNCRAWLYKILFNVIHHHRRKWLRFKWNSEPLDALESTLVYREPVRASLGDEEILRALAKVPQHYRDVVVLADVEEFTYREVAGILGIPMGTVMSRLSRDRAILRAELGAAAEGYGIAGEARERA